MTLRKSKAARASRVSLSPERCKIRALLKKASNGNVYAFAQATASYTNLMSEYLYLTGVTDPRERLFQVQQLLADCWRYLPYTRRVSDFERFLQVNLERTGQRTSLRLGSPHEALSALDHRERFLLAARVFEGWSLKSLKLAFRCNKRDLAHDLMQLKCKLCGFQTHLLRANEQHQVLRVSELLEGGLSDVEARKVERELATHYHAHQFKADWLSYRCELADLRLEIVLDETQSAELNQRIFELLKQQPMEQPRLTDSIINQFTFVRLPSR